MYEAVVEKFFFSTLLMSFIAGNADKEIFSLHENDRAPCEWKCNEKMSSGLSQFSNQQCAWHSWI